MGEVQRDLDLSDDEDTPVPDPPAFTGLFPPNLFKSLLHKARGSGGGYRELDYSNNRACLFSKSLAEKEEIPAPQLFLDVVKKQWAKPSTFPYLS